MGGGDDRGSARPGKRSGRRSLLGATWVALALAACTNHGAAPTSPRAASLPLETKPWHVSAGWHDSDISSTMYPEVDWSVIEQLRPGMTAARAKELLGALQSYHHPVNAIAFARNPAEGWRYEIALKLSSDGTLVEDLSFKHVERTVTGDFWDEPPEQPREK